MRGHHPGQPRLVRRADLKPDAPAQECLRERPLAVAGQDDEGEFRALDPAVLELGDAAKVGGQNRHRWFLEPGELRNDILAFLEYIEQVTSQVDVAFIDLVNEQRPWP